MEKNYLMFAVKVNVYLFLISILLGLLSGIIMIPLILISAVTFNPMLLVLSTAIWFGVVAIIPYYWAFKSAYKESGLALMPAIYFTIGLKIVIDIIFTYFQHGEFLDPWSTAITVSISATIAFIVFYFAGTRYPQITKFGHKPQQK